MFETCLGMWCPSCCVAFKTLVDLIKLLGNPQVCFAQGEKGPLGKALGSLQAALVPYCSLSLLFRR